MISNPILNDFEDPQKEYKDVNKYIKIGFRIEKPIFLQFPFIRTKKELSN